MTGMDIVATIRFYTTSEGGRQGPFLSDRYGAPFGFEGEYFESFLWLEGIGAIEPGQTVTVPVIFLRPELVKPRLSVGSKFTLWEGGTKAEGTVKEILPDRPKRNTYTVPYEA